MKAGSFNSDSDDLPQALLHQAAIAVAVHAVFNLPPDAYNALFRGGARVCEKLLRSYHYWVEEHVEGGICPYDRPLLGYFRMSGAARSALPDQQVHCEHVVPIRVLIDELRSIRETNGRVLPEEVQRVMDANEIVVLSEAEAATLNGAYRSTMPVGWALELSHLMRVKEVLNIDDLSLIGSRRIGPVQNATI